MKVMLVDTGEKLTVDSAYGARLIEQAKAAVVCHEPEGPEKETPKPDTGKPKGRRKTP